MIRRPHRWLGLAFTAGFVANLVAPGLEEPPVWLGPRPRAALLLIATGLALLVRGARPSALTRRLHRRASVVFLLGFLANLGAWVRSRSRRSGSGLRPRAPARAPRDRARA
ncbi:MAG: hypothetical protein R3F62_03275 [Planctomycetota bacterium]